MTPQQFEQFKKEVRTLLDKYDVSHGLFIVATQDDIRIGDIRRTGKHQLITAVADGFAEALATSDFPYKIVIELRKK